MRTTRWRRVFSWLAVTFIFGSAVSGWGQDKKGPMCVLIVQVEAKPDRTAEYEAALRELHKVYAEENFPFATVAFRNENEYLYEVPVATAGLIDLSPLEEAMMEFRQSIGQKTFLRLANRVAKNMIKKSSMIVSKDPRLSHSPENPIFEFDYSKTCFLAVEEWRIAADKEMEAMKFFREYAALAKERGSRIPFVVTRSIIAADCPRYWVGNIWRDEAQWKEQGGRFEELLGDETLIDILRSISRGHSVLKYSYSPELSYFPKE